MGETETAKFALMYGVMSVVVSWLIGYVIAKQVSPNHTLFKKSLIAPKTPHEYGRQGLAYAIMLLFITLFPKVLVKQDVDAFAQFAIPFVFYSLVFYLASLAFGFFRLRRK